MSPTSCQTAPPRARFDVSRSKRREVKLWHFGGGPSTSSDSPGPSGLQAMEDPADSPTSGRPALEHRLRQCTAVDVLQLSSNRQAPGDPGQPQPFAAQQLAD